MMQTVKPKEPTTAYEVLVAAKELIKSPAYWTKHAMFAKVDGNDCQCSIGAVLKAGGVPLRRTHFGVESFDYEALHALGIYGVMEDKGLCSLPNKKLTPGQKAINTAVKYLEAAAVSIHGEYIRDKGTFVTHAYRFNDLAETTHADVMKLFEVAIKGAKRRHLPKPRKTVTSDRGEVAL